MRSPLYSVHTWKLPNICVCISMRIIPLYLMLFITSTQRLLWLSVKCCHLCDVLVHPHRQEGRRGMTGTGRQTACCCCGCRSCCSSLSTWRLSTAPWTHQPHQTGAQPADSCDTCMPEQAPSLRRPAALRHLECHAGLVCNLHTLCASSCGDCSHELGGDVHT